MGDFVDTYWIFRCFVLGLWKGQWEFSICCTLKVFPGECFELRRCYLKRSSRVAWGKQNQRKLCTNLAKIIKMAKGAFRKKLNKNHLKNFKAELFSTFFKKLEIFTLIDSFSRLMLSNHCLWKFSKFYQFWSSKNFCSYAFEKKKIFLQKGFRSNIICFITLRLKQNLQRIQKHLVGNLKKIVFFSIIFEF